MSDEPAPATTTRTRSWSPIGSGEIIGFAGAAAVVVSLFLSWRSGNAHPSDIPAAFLWNRTTSSTDPSLLVFLIPAAALLVLGLWPRIGAGIRLLGAVISLAVAGVFAYQLDRSLFAGGSLGDVLDAGFYVAAVGGFLGFLSAFAASRVRRDTVAYERAPSADRPLAGRAQ
ncbi:MAG TPA: hypothetical protein VFC99_13725 [Acidimicrobiia bacterium]|nr:hypothetical protein [Acidimicrobiia bacterium]